MSAPDRIEVSLNAAVGTYLTTLLTQRVIAQDRSAFVLFRVSSDDPTFRCMARIVTGQLRDKEGNMERTAGSFFARAGDQEMTFDVEVRTTQITFTPRPA